jgi:glycosyltransferase involved in cell wall biosynthesis
MKNQPLVSVIMPVYNGEKFLRDSIESILNQTYKNFEFIIVDDGSTDNSVRIIKEYQKKDKRIKLIENKKNLGQSKSLKIGLKNTKGFYYSKMDCDDISDKNRLEKELDFLEKNKDYVIVGSNLEIIDEDKKKIGYRFYPQENKEIKKTLIFKSPFAYPSTMIKLELLKTIIYDEKYLYCEDYDLWFKLLKYGKGKNLPDFLLKYRINKNQVKSKRLKIQLKETIQVQRKYLFTKEYFSLLALINHLLLYLLYFLPNFLVLCLFKKVEFRKYNV